LYCWGENAFWNHGGPGPDQASPFAPAAVQLGFVEMARGPASQFFCGIRSDRSAVCWGRGGFGMTGRGTLDLFRNTPAPVAGGISWAEITTNRLSACGVSTTGEGYCWGSNQRGEIGRASVPLGGSNVPASLTTAPALLDGGLTWRSVVAGWLHACGITADREAYCWGDNSRGQLGLGTIDNTTDHRSPAPVAGGYKFIQLSLGATHTCGVTLQQRSSAGARTPPVRLAMAPPRTSRLRRSSAGGSDSSMLPRAATSPWAATSRPRWEGRRWRDTPAR
jgi:alpha-tubulin suppressor-like RCC1 family protein